MEGSTDVSMKYDLAVDLMDMNSDMRLFARPSDVRPGFQAGIGGYAIVGDEDADPRVARIVDIDSDGNIELEILRGSVEANRRFVTPT
jgi:hypothetical protein